MARLVLDAGDGAADVRYGFHGRIGSAPVFLRRVRVFEMVESHMLREARQLTMSNKVEHCEFGMNSIQSQPFRGSVPRLARILPMGEDLKDQHADSASKIDALWANPNWDSHISSPRLSFQVAFDGQTIPSYTLSLTARNNIYVIDISREEKITEPMADLGRPGVFRGTRCNGIDR